MKSGTIEKRVGRLRAAINLAIDEGRLKFNPFAGVVPERNDKMKRLPLSGTDMRTIKRNLSQLGKSDQLLLRTLGATGMRLSEAIRDKRRGQRARRSLLHHRSKDAAVIAPRAIPGSCTALPAEEDHRAIVHP